MIAPMCLPTLPKGQDDRGIALPFVLLISIAFVFLSVSIVSVSMNAVRMSGHSLAHNRAQTAAEAGVDDYVARLNTIPNWIACTKDTVKNLDDASAKTCVDALTTTGFTKANNPFTKPQAMPDGLSEYQYSVEYRQRSATADLPAFMGWVLRVTGREKDNQLTARTFEVELVQDNIAWYSLISRFSSVDPDLVMAMEDYPENRWFNQLPSPWSNSQISQMKYFGQGGWPGSLQQYPPTGYGWRFEMTREHAQECMGSRAHNTCVRQAWTRADTFNGDVRTGQSFVIGSLLKAPRTFSNEYLAQGASLYGGLFGRTKGKSDLLPDVTGNIIVGSYMATTDASRLGNEVLSFGLGLPSSNFESLLETIGGGNIIPDSANAPTMQYKAPKSMPPVDFAKLRKDATCVFEGPTYIKFNGNTLNIAHPLGAPEKGCTGDYTYTGAMVSTSTGSTISAPQWVRHVASSTTQTTVPDNAIIYVGQASKTKECKRTNSPLDINGLYIPGQDNVLHPDSLGDCHSPTVFVEGDIFDKVTVVSEGDIVLVGPTYYKDRITPERVIPRTATSMLGLLAKKDVVVYWPVSDVTGMAAYKNNNPAEGMVGNDTYDAAKSLKLLPFHDGHWETKAGEDDQPHTLVEKKPIQSSSMLGYLGNVPPHFDAVILAKEGSFHVQNPLAPFGYDIPYTSFKDDVQRRTLRVFGSVGSQYGVFTGRAWGDLPECSLFTRPSPTSSGGTARPDEAKCNLRKDKNMFASQFPANEFSWDERLAYQRPPGWPESQDKLEWRSRGFVETAGQPVTKADTK